MDEKIKWIASAILGMIGAFTQQYGAMIIMVCFVLIFDLITGLIKAKINGTVNSAKGTKGLFKKLAFLVGLFFGFFLDYSIPYMCTYVSIDIPFKLPFGMIICFYIVLNESISICENLYECDNNIMPKWIVNILQSAKDKIEDGGSDGENLSEK